MQIAPWEMISQLYCMKHNYHSHFGGKHLPLKSMSRTMSSLNGMSPCEAWFKQEPDVSHLCVWRCLAYVFIQKNKECSLQQHMEKCVFVTYPSGYKAWKFYNATTQTYLISECTEFDESFIPGLSKSRATSPVNLTPSGSPPLLPVVRTH